MLKSDPTLHYPRDVLFFEMSSVVYKTTGTMCGKRRRFEYVTVSVSDVECKPCLDGALSFWHDQASSCYTMIKLYDQGTLNHIGTPQQVLADMAKIRTSLDGALFLIRRINRNPIMKEGS